MTVRTSLNSDLKDAPRTVSLYQSAKSRSKCTAQNFHGESNFRRHFTPTRHCRWSHPFESAVNVAEVGMLMELMRPEVNEFARASEKLLGYEVKLEELTRDETRDHSLLSVCD